MASQTRIQIRTWLEKNMVVRCPRFVKQEKWFIKASRKTAAIRTIGPDRYQVYEAFEFAGGCPPGIQVHEGPRD